MIFKLRMLYAKYMSLRKYIFQFSNNKSLLGFFQSLYHCKDSLNKKLKVNIRLLALNSISSCFIAESIFE